MGTRSGVALQVTGNRGWRLTGGPLFSAIELQHDPVLLKNEKEVLMAPMPRPSGKLTSRPLKKNDPPTQSDTELDEEAGQGVYHPDVRPSSRPRSHGVGTFLTAYAIQGVMEFAFSFSMKTLGESNTRTPGMRRISTITYKTPLEGTPHFAAVNSFSGKFVKENGELADRPLGALEVSVWIKEPGKLTCAVRLSDRNSDDPVEVSVRGVLVFFQ